MSLNHSYVFNELAYDRQRELIAEADQSRLGKLANGSRLSWWHRLMARVGEREVVEQPVVERPVVERPVVEAAPATPVAAGVGQPAPC